MARRGSLAWVFLLALVTLAVGGMLWLSFDQFMSQLFDQPGWVDAANASSPKDTATAVEKGQRSLQSLWAVVPIILVVAVAFSVLVRGRRAGR